MSEVKLKNEIYKHLEQMNATQLQSAWLILKALSNHQKYTNTKTDQLAVDADCQRH